MIVGTGIDIVECDRLQKSLDKFGQSFVDYFCTAAEQAAAPSNPNARLVYYASRWAPRKTYSEGSNGTRRDETAWENISVVSGLWGIFPADA